SGDASGLRRNAWNTTPATAKAPPTSAAARTRGRRATKNTCASTLSPNGIDRSKTRASEIGVAPTSGAATHTATVSALKAAIVTTIRRRKSVGAAKRNHRHVSGAGVHRDLGVDAVERPDILARQHVARRSGGHHPSRLQQHQ